MGIVISSILLLAVILSGVLFVSGAMMNAVDSAAAAGKETGKIITERALASIDIATAAYVSGYSQVILLNNGHTSIGDFSEWDVFVHYVNSQHGSTMEFPWIVYDPAYPPQNDKWAKEGIYLDSSTTVPEVYEPGILNPGEYLKLAINLGDKIKKNTSVYIKVSPPNGSSDNITYIKN